MSFPHGPVAAPLQRRAAKRAAGRVREACQHSSTTDELIDGLCQVFTDTLGVAGLIIGSTDPATAMVSTATRVQNLPHSMASPWMHNEAFERDFNKFTELHRTASGAATLHRATQGNPSLSSRYRLNLRMGLGPELRITFSAGPDCWGIGSFVREAADADFDDTSLRWVEGLRPAIAAGLRRTMGHDQPEAADHAPGVVALDSEGGVISMTADARALLSDLWMCPMEGLDHTLPGEAYMVATMARARGTEPGSPASTRLRGRSGRWITMRADRLLTVAGEPAGVALIIERSRPIDVLPLVLAAHGLTLREREVLVEMTDGATAGEIAERLFISEHTVRDHVKAILAKTGTGSRGELMGLLFHDRA